MLRSILIALDGSESDIAAEELGIRWARQFEAQLTAISIVDDLGTQFTEDGLIDRTDREPVAASLVLEPRSKFRAALKNFTARCEGAGVEFLALEADGSPHKKILSEAQRHDLILIGGRSRFEYGWEGQPGQTLGLVLRDASRPVVAVPEALMNPMPEPIVPGPALVAYDGSLQAARTLYAFLGSGLAYSRTVHVVSLAAEEDEATRHSDRAVDFLRSHEVDVFGHPQATRRRPADVIVEKIHDYKADLLVMGAYGQPTLKEFFIGSVTRALLESSPIPVFSYH